MAGMNVFVVSYDIMDPKRLLKVYKTMKGFGEPIHYSVFRCILTPRGRVELKAALFDLSELPRPEGRGFPLHRQYLHHGYVM